MCFVHLQEISCKGKAVAFGIHAELSHYDRNVLIMAALSSLLLRAIAHLAVS